MPVVAAVLIEPENDPKKVLRVTLPLGMSLQPGTRVIVDNGQPMTGPYVTCFNNGCLADVAVGPDFVDGLKKGLLLTVEAKSLSGPATSFVMRLGGFAQAYDGPPADPKVFLKQQEDNFRTPWKDDRLDPKIFRKSIQQ